METKRRRFRIGATSITPYVEYIPQESILKIKGRSSPHSSLDFFRPIIHTIKKHRPEKSHFVADFQMEYFNTSTSKCLYDLFKELVNFQKQGIQININWRYEDDDEDMLETGEDFENAIGLQFNYISYASL